MRMDTLITGYRASRRGSFRQGKLGGFGAWAGVGLVGGRGGVDDDTVYWWLIMGIFPHIDPAREAVAHCGPAAVATGSQ